MQEKENLWRVVFFPDLFFSAFASFWLLLIHNSLRNMNSTMTDNSKTKPKETFFLKFCLSAVWLQWQRLANMTLNSKYSGVRSRDLGRQLYHKAEVLMNARLECIFQAWDLWYWCYKNSELNSCEKNQTFRDFS